MPSYADLVTLLLALFTVLYAASSVDAVKMSPVANSVREAFDAPPVAAVQTAGAAASEPWSKPSRRRVSPGRSAS